MKAELISYFGDDLMIANVARVSYDKQSTELSEKDARLLKFLAEHKHTCYDDETEIFTEIGFVKFSELNKNIKVAAIDNNGYFNFELPSNYYEGDYQGDLIYFKHGHVDLAVTPNHRMWVSKRYSNRFGEFEFKTAEEIFDKHYRLSTTSKYKNFGSEGKYENGFLYGFFLGDGCVYSKDKIIFRLKKERKIKKLRNILLSTNISFEERVVQDEIFEFILNSPNKYFSGKSETKKINNDIFKMSEEYLLGVWDGLMNSDGSQKRNSYTYHTISEELKNSIITLGVLLGKNVRENKRRKDGCYSLMVLNRSLKPRLNDHNKHNYKKYYEGKIYCVEVSTGRLLVRRRNKQVVCGNSPFRHAQIQFRIECPIFVERQLFTHQIGWARNSISGRYVDFSDTYWLPEKLRYQSKDSKQGSAGNIPEELNGEFQKSMAEVLDLAQNVYKRMCEAGVSKEQCRIILPLALETKFIWTGSFHALMHLFSLRLKPDTQQETRDLVTSMLDLVKNIEGEPFKYSLQAWGY